MVDILFHYRPNYYWQLSASKTWTENDKPVYFKFRPRKDFPEKGMTSVLIIFLNLALHIGARTKHHG